MDVGVITVFRMSHLARVVCSGHVSGGFFHCLVFRSGISAGKGKVSWDSRLFTTRNEITTSHMCLCGDSVSTFWKIPNFIISQNLQGIRDKCCLASKEWPSGGDL